jgi:hemerythrin
MGTRLILCPAERRAMPGATRNPEKFRALDEEHDELLEILGDMKKAADGGDNDNTELLAKTVLRKLIQHSHHEESLMREYGYPGYENHKTYHEHVNDTLKFIIEYFGDDRLHDSRQEVAQHMENKVSEELFVDQLFMEYLAGK